MSALDWGHGEFRFTRLPPAKSDQELELHLCAVEYALANPIAIASEADIESTVHWRDRVKPFPHQIRNLITFCRRAPVALFADDVGLGKTISAGLVLSELLTRKRVRRALVVAPSVLLEQWVDELDGKFGIRAVAVRGNKVRDALAGRSKVVVTTYHTASRYMSEIRQSQNGFDFLILDEAHQLKNLYGNNNGAPKMAIKFREALADQVFQFVLMLTATPLQNRLWDLYSLVDLLTVARNHRNPFGSPQEFQRTFIADASGKAMRIIPGKEGDLRQRLSQYMVRTSRFKSGLVFPDRVVDTRSCAAGTVEQEMVATLKSVWRDINALQRSSLAEAMMSSPAAFAEQMANAAASRPSLRDAAANARRIASASPVGSKFDELVRFIEGLRQRPSEPLRVVVFTRRIKTQEVLGAALKELGVKVGFIRGGAPVANRAAIVAFHDDPPGVNVLVSTDAGAAGINLQVANVVVNYDLPWNPMVVEQRIGRVQRLNSRFAKVAVMNLVVADSVEERIVARLLTRLQAIAHTVGDIEGILQSLGSDDGDPEDTIRELVLAAFEGQNVEEQARSYEEAIRQAQEEFSAQEAVVEETLGDLSGMHSAGPAVPKLDPVTPRWDARTFVRTALAEESAQVVELPDGRWRVHRPGSGPITITFDETDVTDADGGFVPVFGGRPVEFFGPGSPGFERLVGTWAQRASHRVLDARGALIADPIEVGREWAKSFGINSSVVDVRIKDRTERFTGTASLRADAHVKHDRIERLYELNIGTPPAPNVSKHGSSQYVDEPIGPKLLPESEQAPMVHEIQDQPAFRAFGTFYRARRTEEVAKTPSPEAKAIVHRDFTPFANASVQSLRGVLQESVDVEVEYVIETSEPYRSMLRIEAGAILEQPQRAKCSVSEALVPLEVLEKCSASGRKAMRHRLETSAVSGALALPEHTTTCSVSGVRMLTSEAVTSSVSGRIAAPDFAGTCPVTGKSALHEEFVACEFTGTKVLPDALGTSEISGKRSRTDELVPSSVSGIKGHRTEFLTCAETRLPLLQTEGATTAIDGRFVRRDLLAASGKNPTRLGMRRDMVTCAISGMQLLPDEVMASEFSGKRADPTLLIRSDVSGRMALPSEIVRCEETEATLLPDESGVCADTGKRVRSDLLRTNDITGTTMLDRVLSICPETGKRGRESDLVQCEVTGYRVDPMVTTRCTETHKTVLERLTVTCAACNERLLKERAVKVASGAFAHSTHTERCVWTNELHVPRDLRRCAHTGVLVRADLIASQGTLRILGELEERVRARAADDSDLRDVVASALPKKARVAKVWCRSNPNANRIAFIAELPGFLGLTRRKVAGILDRTTGTALGNIHECN